MSIAPSLPHAIFRKREVGCIAPRRGTERNCECSSGSVVGTAMTGVWTLNTSEISVERGSGNVFADLDLPDAESLLLKAELVSRINDIIRQRRTIQAEAARALGLSRPDLSRLLRGSFQEYSLERLLRFLMSLGCDIDIVIRPSVSDTGGTLRIAPSVVS